MRGACPLDRVAVSAEQAFLAIAQKNVGRCFLCNPGGDPEQLEKQFAEIAAQAQLSAQGDAVGARLLLEHLQAVPFEMTVAVREPSARCASRSDWSQE